MPWKTHETTDPLGRRVVFDWRAEAHLVQHRAWILEHRVAILDAIHSPDFLEDDPIADRERFYRRHFDDYRWLRTVVDFSENPAWVVTAFVQDRPPERSAI